MDSLLETLPEDTSIAKYRQITDFVRNLITKGDLKPGTQLPPIKALAQQWGTNYFTVRLALTPLTNEGLIERSPGRGSFVRNRPSQLSSVAIYYGSNLWTDPKGIFYQKLYHDLQSCLEKRNIRVVTFIDTRSAASKHKPLPELVKATEQREVHGILGPLVSPAEVVRLTSLGLPLSIFGMDGVRTDYEQIATLSLDRLAADGCKTVGTISATDDYYPLFEKLATARGMTTVRGWCRHGDPHFNSELFGYHSFKEIWAHQVRPEGLIIHHDGVCQGAITAILELGVSVPQNLKLILYRNAGLNYLCPWKVPYVVLDPLQVAAMLVSYVEEQHKAGRLDLKPPALPVELVN